MQIHHLRKGDRLPSLRIRCFDANGQPVDFGSSTATFTMESETGTTKVSASSASVLANGVLRYSWGASDTDTAGRFRAWFTVTTGGLAWSFPNREQTGSLYVDIAETT